MKDVMNSLKIIKKTICYILAITFVVALLPNVMIVTEASGIDNIVARADYLYSIKWTAQKDVNGWKNRADTKYVKGKSYRIPYGQPVSAGKYVCWGISVNNFYEAAMDGSSDFYSKRSKNGSYESVYYAMDCSAFVSYCWGLSSRTDTRSWANLSVTSYGKCTTSNIQKLQKGDALNLAGSHIVLVTDVIKSDGKVTKIEITEQTPPQIKRTTHTVDTLANAYSSYTIYRYKNRDAVKAPPAPNTPKISSVSATADTEITIKWNSVAGATKYVLNGRKAGGDYVTIANNIEGTSYTHKNLDAGSLYWYKVQAVNDSGSSGFSSAAGAYTKPATPTVSSSTTNSIQVNWSSSGGSTNYELLARKCGTDGYVTIAENIEGYTYTHNGLEAGTQYYYKVKAHNKEHTSIVSMRSDEGSGITKLQKPTVTAKTAKTVSLDWSRGTLNGDYTYTYRVARKAAGDSSYSKVAVISSSSYTDSGLKPNTTYDYYIDVLKNGSYLICSEHVIVTTNAQLAESVSVTPNNVTLIEGDTYTLSATVLPADTTNKTVTWTSDNTSVAVVSSNGTITAKGKGAAKITVKTSNGLMATCAVTVVKLEEVCTHTYGAWVTSTQATCEHTGHKYRKCSICGKEEGENIPALGHNYSAEWTITKEATCSEYGERKHLCTACGEAEPNTIESIETLAHTCGDLWTVEIEPTCLQTGVKYKTCSICNEKCETEEIPVIAHMYNDEWFVEQEATCQQERVLYRSCIECGEKEYRYEERAEHNYIAIDVKDPTYTEEGYATYECSYCKDTYTDIIPKDTVESEIIVEHIVASAGDTVDVRIDLVNNPGIIYGKFEVIYDTALTLVDVKDNGLLGNANHSNNKKSPYILYWNNGTATEDYTADGTVVTLTFKIADDAEEGTYLVDIREVESSTFNYNDETVYFSAVSGNIIVNNTIIGDVNGDGEVTARDERDLSRHIAGWVGYEGINLRAADVNGDGEVTARDERDLSRHIAGWIGYEVLPKQQ